MTREEMRERVRAYLSGGGLFNPELANHDAVRDLIMDLDAAIAIIRGETLEEAARCADRNAAEAWQEGAEETRGLMRLQAADIAAAIRALKEKP